MAGLLARRRRALEGLEGKVGALSPLKVLERGYGLVRAADGRVVASAGAVDAGEAVTVTLRDGELDARVESVRRKR
jgi:exodeoxyribonuclease VII large subunit